MFDIKAASCINLVAALILAAPSIAELRTKQDFDDFNLAAGTIAGWTIKAQLYWQIQGALSNEETLIRENLTRLMNTEHSNDGLLLDVKIGYDPSGYGVFQGIEYIGTGSTPECAYFSMYKTGSIRQQYPGPTDPDASYMVWLTSKYSFVASSSVSIQQVFSRQGVINSGRSNRDCFAKSDITPSDITPPAVPSPLIIR